MIAKSSKLVVARKGLVLLVRRRSDRLWTFPGGKRKRARESAKRCLLREIREELPALRLGSARLWRNIKGKNPISGKRMNDAIFIVTNVAGMLVIGDEQEIDRAEWREPFRVRLTPTSRFIRDQLFASQKSARRSATRSQR
jgi:8-oxo-dGTP diphosphatase